MITSLLAMTVLLGTAPPPAGRIADAQVIIWAGGDNPEQAKHWSESFAGARGPLAGTFQLAEGYPQIVESAKIAGMKPGFFVVVLGFCPLGKEERPLKFFKAIFPGTYVRRVHVAPDSCPQLSPGLQLVSSRSRVTSSATIVLTYLRRGGAVWGHAWAFAKTGDLLCPPFALNAAMSVDCIRLERDDTGEIVLKSQPQCTGAEPEVALPVDDAGDDCVEQTVHTGSFSRRGAQEEAVLEICTHVASSPQSDSPSTTAKRAILKFRRGDKVLASKELDAWENGWEWASDWSMDDPLPMGNTGRLALVLRNQSYQEGDSLASKSAEMNIIAFDGRTFATLCHRQANAISLTPQSRGLHVKTRDHLSGEGSAEQVEAHSFLIVYDHGEFVERKP